VPLQEDEDKSTEPDQWLVGGVVLPSIARAPRLLVYFLGQLMSYSSDLLNTTSEPAHVNAESQTRTLPAARPRRHGAVERTRLEFLELLAQGERSVDQLAARPVDRGEHSQHLQKLRQAGLILGRKQGQYVFYQLTGDNVVGLLEALGNVGETHLAEVERIVRLYMAAKDDLSRCRPRSCSIGCARAWSRYLMSAADEFAAGHVPGAVNIPIRNWKGA